MIDAKKLPKLRYCHMKFGCDPEFFFTRNGKVVGSERVIGEKGVKDYGCNLPKIIRDGVQVELNPLPSFCRANLGNEIKQCFVLLRNNMGDDVGASFASVIKVPAKEFRELSEDSKKFGCKPSFNVGGVSEITVDPAVNRYRSAGGHIHIGSDHDPVLALKMPERLIPIMDIIVGNTCVLVDRDPKAKERRKNYGRAGEYRTPEYGIEYRTLSNFWLRSYQLMSFVMGLARVAVHIVETDISNGNTMIEDALYERVDTSKVSIAINNNNARLAMKNFVAIEDVLLHVTKVHTDSYPITVKTIKYFKHFIKKPLEYWFPDDPIKHWCNIPEGHGTGWENFCVTKIDKDMKKDMEKVQVNA